MVCTRFQEVYQIGYHSCLCCSLPCCVALCCVVEQCLSCHRFLLWSACLQCEQQLREVDLVLQAIGLILPCRARVAGKVCLLRQGAGHVHLFSAMLHTGDAQRPRAGWESYAVNFWRKTGYSCSVCAWAMPIQLGQLLQARIWLIAIYCSCPKELLDLVGEL